MIEQRFNLELAARQYVRAERWLRVLFFIMGGALGAFDIYNVLTTPFTAIELQLSVVSWVGVAAIWWIGLMTAVLPPIELRIDSEGWAFIEKSGKRRSYIWNDPHLRFGFLDARGYRLGVDDPARVPFQVIADPGGFLTPHIVLTPEAFVGLLTAAMGQGVAVLPSDWAEVSPNQRHVVITNRVPAT
ncbi:MAG: hypothetical protein ACREDK_03275 [Thermoplasmata archaeon]